MQDELNNPLVKENNQEGMTRNESGLSFHIINYHEKKGSFLNEMENLQDINSNQIKNQGILSTPNNRTQSDKEFAFSSGKQIQMQKDSYTNVISISEQDGGSVTKFQQLMGNKKGLFYMIIASICFSFSAFFVKKVENNQISELELMFYRSLFIIFFLFIIYKLSQRDEHPDNEIQEYSKNNITFIHMSERNFVKIYSILNGIIVFSYFYGIKMLPLYEAVSLQNCSMFFTGIFGCFSLFQTSSIKFQAKELICIVLIGIGVYLISYQESFKASMVCIIGGSFVSALIQVIIRRYQTNTEFMKLLFYTSFIQLIVSPIYILFFLKFHHVSLQDIILIAIQAFLQIAGTKYLQMSFMSLSDGRYVNFHVQGQIVFTLILGHFFLQDHLQRNSLIGCLFIVASSILMILKFKQ
ncbi:hypothetical protein ABPG72_018950 [Tetrahymena utriculariae]